MDEKLCSAQQVADHLGLSKATVYRYAKSNLIPSLQATPNSHRRFSLKKVITALENTNWDEIANAVRETAREED